MISPHDPNFQSRADRGNGGVSLSPEWEVNGKSGYLLGTDRLGRDIFARLLYATRTSFLIGIVPALLSVFFGVLVGILAGYLRGKVEAFFMRITEIVLAFPNILLLLVVVAILRDSQAGPYQIGNITIERFYIVDLYDGIPIMIFALTITSWGETARLVRSRVLSLSETEFVLSATAIGASKIYIMRVYLLGNLTPLILADIVTAIPRFIINEAFLSFIGLGIPPPNPSWGSLLNDGYKSIQQLPQLIWAPVVCITMLVYAFSIISESTLHTY